MKTLFSVGSIHVAFFGTMIMLGLLAALGILYYEAKRKKMNPDKIFDMAIIGFIGGIVGARIGYILFYNLEFYLSNPLEMLQIYDGGLSIHGGVIGGSIVVLLFLRKNEDLNMWDVADIVAPALILAQGIGRVGCDVYGKVMKNPMFWGVPVQGTIYHPAQVYEFLLDYLFFIYLWRKRKKLKFRGQLFGIYIIGFALIRSIVELSRSNPQFLGIFSVSHLLSIGLIVFGVLWLKFAAKRFVLQDAIENNMETATYKIEVTTYKDVWIIGFLIIVSLGVFYVVQLYL